MITYRVSFDVPLQLVIKVSNLPGKRLKELSTRNGTRALTCYQQFTISYPQISFGGDFDDASVMSLPAPPRAALHGSRRITV